jgi:nucleotide-binding universal stress UspA family protein
MVKKILVPVDGSRHATKALRYAVDLAKQTGAAIIGLSVVDTRLHVAQSVPPSRTVTHLTEPLEDYMRQAALKIIDTVEKMCRVKGLKSKKIVRSGHPVKEILKEAGKSKVDLIIMGSHGRGALEAAFLGSTTFGVIHSDTKYPVLVVRR